MFRIFILVLLFPFIASGEIFQDREFIIRESTEPNSPFVIMLHPGNSTAGRYLIALEINDLFPDNVTIVYASADPARRDVGARVWQSGGLFGNDITDILYIRDLRNHIMNNYSIDPERVYLVGSSNGGMMAYRIAHAANFNYAGVVVISATALLNSPYDYGGKVMHIHGLSDGRVPIEGIVDEDGTEIYLPLMKLMGIIAEQASSLFVVLVPANHRIANIKTAYPNMLNDIVRFIEE